ncbi:unnamed protein product [Mytilus coruscus]|uniref:Uncharacterized protein n=1 Tax=Mytilus coruscus TaxID=42192 RepID=A0A6J8A001_MYTCO|nr:unnamed protein product [Mytilus coruscus]
MKRKIAGANTAISLPKDYDDNNSVVIVELIPILLNSYKDYDNSVVIVKFKVVDSVEKVDVDMVEVVDEPLRPVTQKQPLKRAAHTKQRTGETSMSKMVNAEWQKFGKSIGKDLPKLTASLNRKLAVTTMREAGADRQIQTALAKHMAHNPETADRFYDKSRRTTDRHAALDSVQGQYKQAFQEKKKMFN